MSSRVCEISDTYYRQNKKYKNHVIYIEPTSMCLNFIKKKRQRNKLPANTYNTKKQCQGQGQVTKQ